MKARDFLSRIRVLDTIIQQKRQELDNLQEIASSISAIDYGKDRVQISPTGEAPFAKTAEKATELDAEIRKVEDKRLEIIEYIQKVGDNRYIAILYKRYVEGKHFDIIAKEMGYVLSSAYRIHGEALAEFERSNHDVLRAEGASEAKMY